MTAPILSKGDLVQVVESRHPALKGKQVTVDGIIVRGADSDGIVDSVAAVGTVAGSTFTPKPGQQVRVVKCLGALCHDGQVGTFLYELSSDWIVSLADGLTCAATEVAPVWQPGDALTTEPPIGSTVRIGQAYYRLGRDGTSWFDQGDMHRYSWEQLTAMATLDSTDVIFVSHEEARTTFVVGEVVTPEMGEPPVGSVVRFRATSGYYWRQRSWLPLDGNHDIIEARPPETWDNLRVKGARTRQEIFLVSLPDDQPEEPDGYKWEPGDIVNAEPPVGFTVSVGHTYSYFTRRNEHRSMCWEGIGGGWYSWENLRSMSAADGSYIMLVSDGNSQPAPTPQPQTREVPLGEARQGDQVVIRGEVARIDEHTTEIVVTAPQHASIILNPEATTGHVTVTRVITPLPTTPGTVGIATIRGDVRDVRVYRIPDGSDRPWVTFLGGVQARHTDGQISDFVELLPGEDR